MTQVTVDLSPIRRRDLKKMLVWRNDWRIMDWTRQSDYIDEIQHEAWFDRQSSDPTIRMYRVMAKMQGKTSFVGVCGLTSIDWANRRAEFSLYINPALHKVGLGSMAIRVLLNHGFSNLGLGLIWGETFEGNPAAKMFEKIGFQKEGTRRAFYFKNGKFIDAHLYSITAEEWRARATGHLSNPNNHPSPSGPNGSEPDPGGDPLPPTPIRPRKKRAGAQAGAVLEAEVVRSGDSGITSAGADSCE